MNEKIRELVVNSGFATGYDRTQTGRWILSDKELDKFAELIVQECIRTIQMGITRDGHDNEKYLRSVKHIKQIKEHFGVEE